VISTHIYEPQEFLYIIVVSVVHEWEGLCTIIAGVGNITADGRVSIIYLLVSYFFSNLKA